jgi:uncharacterized membrane protein
MGTGRKLTDKRIEILIGTFLRIGVIAAALIVLAGGVIYLVEHGTETASFKNFRGEPKSLENMGGIIAAALSLESRGIIQAGLLLLISIPILRVMVSVFAFALEKDWLYVVFTIAVLAILVYSLLGGGPAR